MSEQEKKLTFEEEMFQDARGSYASFQLPTGWLNVETKELVKDILLKEMTGVEEDILGSKSMTSLDRMNTLMANCIHSIGSITDREKIKQIVEDLVSNDRFFLVYKIREISLGPIYSVFVPCPQCKDNSYVRQLDIRDIIFPSLKEPQKRIYEGTLPKSGKKYVWKVQDGHKERDVHNMNLKFKSGRKNDDRSLLSTIIAQRIESFDGRPVKIEDIKQLTSFDRMHLRNEFRKIESEIDDKMIIECPKCMYEFELSIDSNSPEFFFPSEI